MTSPGTRKLRPLQPARRIALVALTGLIAFPAWAQSPLAPPKLTGTIVDTARRPLRDVHFAILGIAEVQSDSAGNFRFASIPSGQLIFKVTKIGFEPVMKLLLPRDGDSLHLDIMMRPAEMAQELEPLMIRGQRYTPETDRTGFERRRLNGFGKYLSTERIIGSHTSTTSMLIRGMAGVVVDNGGVVHINHGVTTLVGRPCKGVQVLINAVVMPDGFNIDEIPKETIRGVELYDGAATTPAELSTFRTSCGTLAIWTW